MANREENLKLLKPKIDVVFQSLFSKKNEKITKAFAEAMLDEKVKKITINDDKELFREKPEDKLGILDLELDINDTEKVDVEIQLVDRSNIQERLLFYFSKLYYNEVKKGDDYKKAKRVVMVAILDYDLDLTKEVKRMETKWKLREENAKDLVLTDKIEIDIIELSKVRAEYERNKQNKKAQWALFINDPNTREVKDIMKENEDIEEAVVTVHKMTEDEKMRRLADLREKAIMDEKAIRRKGYEDGHDAGYEDGMAKGMAKGMAEGMAEGMAQGIAKGIEEEQKRNIQKMKDIAKNLKQMNITNEQICNILKIKKDELEKLLQN